MIGVRLLKLAEADLNTLSELHGHCFKDRWSASYLSSLLITPGTFAVVSGPQSGPDGFVIGRVAADEVEILTLAVRPERRRRGIGSALVDYAAAHAAALGAAAMFLEVDALNVSARGLYAAQGFLPVGERPGYYAASGDSRGDAIILRASLPLAPLGKRPGLG